MLTIEGKKQRFCDGVSRREFLKIGGLALGGLTLPQILAAEAQAGVRSNHKAVIMVYLPGGPPHLDLVDLKPDAPTEIRGAYRPIKTNVPGIEICEHFPHMAKMMDKFTIIRSLVGARNEHASDLCLSGYPIAENRNKFHPSLGAVASKVLGAVDKTVPPFVDIRTPTSHRPYTNLADPGFIGLGHSAIRPSGPVMADMKLRGISISRLAHRRKLLAAVDGYRRIVEASGLLEQADDIHSRAFEILTDAKLVKAMDLSREPQKLRDRYGRGSSKSVGDAGSLWNDQFLMARRLVEAGVRCVTIGFGGWDFHSPGNWSFITNQIRQLDQALSALVQDLHDRGLDQDVSVVTWGDFGRSPRLGGYMGRYAKSGGREHWPQVSFCLLAGGGMRTGQVIGKTNKLAEYADERPVHYRDVFATLYHNLGIDVRVPQIKDAENRPRYIVEGHEPIQELI